MPYIDHPGGPGHPEVLAARIERVLVEWGAGL